MSSYHIIGYHPVSERHPQRNDIKKTKKKQRMTISRVVKPSSTIARPFRRQSWLQHTHRKTPPIYLDVNLKQKISWWLWLHSAQIGLSFLFYRPNNFGLFVWLFWLFWLLIVLFVSLPLSIPFNLRFVIEFADDGGNVPATIQVNCTRTRILSSLTRVSYNI